MLNIKALVAGRGDRRTVPLPGGGASRDASAARDWVGASGGCHRHSLICGAQAAAPGEQWAGRGQAATGPPPGRGTGMGREWLLNGKEYREEGGGGERGDAMHLRGYDAPGGDTRNLRR